jgi:hypothetical protein
VEPRVKTLPYRIDRRAYARMMYPRGLSHRLPLILILLIVLAACLYILGGRLAAILAIVAPLALMALALVARWFIIQRNVTNPESRKVFDIERTVEFGDEGARVKTSDGLNSEIPWSHFVRAEVCRGFTLMFMTAIQHIILPTEAFASPADEATFHELLRAKGLLRPSRPVT